MRSKCPFCGEPYDQNWSNLRGLPSFRCGTLQDEDIWCRTTGCYEAQINDLILESAGKDIHLDNLAAEIGKANDDIDFFKRLLEARHG